MRYSSYLTVKHEIFTSLFCGKFWVGRGKPKSTRKNMDKPLRIHEISPTV